MVPAANFTDNTPTLSELCDDIYFLTNESDDSFSVLRVTKTLNEGLAKVWNQTHKEFDVVSAVFESGDFETVIPDASLQGGEARVIDAFVSGGGSSMELTALTAQDFAMESTSAGVPTAYAINRNVLYLYPTPDESYTITLRYRREFKPLQNDSDVCSMSDAEINAAKYYAAWILKTADEEFDSANAFHSIFVQLLGDLTLQETGLFPPQEGAYYGGAY